MGTEIKRLKTVLIIQIIVGLAAAVFIALFMGTFALDSPAATKMNFFLAAGSGFFILFIPNVLLPAFSIKELKDYEKSRIRLRVNTVNALFCSFLVFPFTVALTFFYLYLIKKITKSGGE